MCFDSSLSNTHITEIYTVCDELMWMKETSFAGFTKADFMFERLSLASVEFPIAPSNF